MKVSSCFKRLLVLLLSVPTMAGAQTSDYNPPNPPEPLTKYQVSVSAEPAEAGYVSGGGKYAETATVNLSTSVRNSNYEFLYWMQDGAQIDKPRSFSYTMGNRKTNFVAVYGYNPGNPQEPTTSYNYKLYLTTDAEGSCTFNMASGLKKKADQYVSVAVQNISPGFVFLGWFANGQKVSSSQSFNYLMPYQDVTLTARMVYDPASPADPSSDSGQDNIQNAKSGDLNGDGIVNVTDAVILINHYLQNTTNELPMGIADTNRDGILNVTDAVGIINIYLYNR